MSSKAMETSTIVMIIVGLVVLALVLMLAFYFGSTTGESAAFKRATDWGSGFSW